MYVTRAYNHIVEFENEIHKLSNTERLADEIYYYATLPSELKDLFPKFLGTEKFEDKYVLKLEKKQSIPVYSVLLGTDYSSNILLKMADRLLTNLTKLHSYKLSNDTRIAYLANPDRNLNYISQSSSGMLLHKTFSELSKLYDSTKVGDSYSQTMKIFEHENTININGKELFTPWYIFDRISDYLRSDEFLKYDETIIHGDLCFSNILYSPSTDEMHFIDPRGSYNYRGCYGDPDYDFAKLLHSFEGGYEFMINGKFTIDALTSYNKITYTIEYPEYWKEVQDVFNKFKTTRRIRLIHALIFLGAAARHYENKDRQMLMLCRGTELLNDFYKENSF